MEKTVLLLALVFVFLSCKETQNTQVSSQTKQSYNTKGLFLEKSRVKLLPVNKAVAKELEGISEYELIKGKIDTLNRLTHWDKENNLDQLSQEITDLPELLPDSFKNNGILSRINQLNTYVLLFEDSLKNKKQEDSLAIENKINLILKSYNSLLVQLNETQYSISKDFEKELQKETFRRDSLEQNEVEPLF